ncbi:MAG: class I SAM-dependent methyltransferase [Sedimentisphaerales bacterium]
MKIKFDDIHTRKKQEKLVEMMKRTTDSLRKIKNDNVILSDCPICESADIVFHVRAYGFDMSTCNGCGLIFCNPYPNEEQLHKYYNSEMKAFENEFFRESFEHRVTLFLPRVKLIQEYKTSGGLLDVGSAIGIFIEALERSNTLYNVSCCDISVEACKELRERYPHIDVINMDFLKMPQGKRYDVITMWDTIEHIVDLNQLLKQIYNILSEDGIFVFSTPNTDSFEWRIAGKKHVQILPPGHVNLMNKKSIYRLLSSKGFDILDDFTLNASLDITYVKKLIESDEVDLNRIGMFLKEEIYDPDFEELFHAYLIKKRRAGNIVVIAKKSNNRK